MGGKQLGDVDHLRGLRRLAGQRADVGAHQCPPRCPRERPISSLVELSWRSSGRLAAASSLAVRFASTLPSSTPHWSKESMFQTTTCTTTLCSYSATSAPSA